MTSHSVFSFNLKPQAARRPSKEKASIDVEAARRMMPQQLCTMIFLRFDDHSCFCALLFAFFSQILPIVIHQTLLPLSPSVLLQLLRFLPLQVRLVIIVCLRSLNHLACRLFQFQCLDFRFLKPRLWVKHQFHNCNSSIRKVWIFH